jgi:hypothetical protein
VRRCIDSKYLLSLELTDPGSDFSLLADFRERIVTGGLEQHFLDMLLTLSQAARPPQSAWSAAHRLDVRRITRHWYPCHRQEALEGRCLGHPGNLDPKGRGDNSILETRSPARGVAAEADRKTRNLWRRLHCLNPNPDAVFVPPIGNTPVTDVTLWASQS